MKTPVFSVACARSSVFFAAGAPDVVANLVGVDPRDELVLGREHEERRAVQRVGARREDRDVLVQLLDPEQDLGALGAADPVALARLDRLRPVDGLEIVEQRLRVVGDPEEPLLHEARLDLRSAALAAPVVHLLVREHRLVVRAPLHRRALPVGEPALEEVQELPLLPAVVRGVVRGQRARPVVRPAHPPHRARDVLDVPLGALTRVDALVDRCVLGGQAERVESLRVQHVHAVARAEARDDVPDRVDEHVPHVQRPRGVREHLEDVALRRAPARSRRGTPARPPRRAATSPRSPSSRTAPSLVSFVSGEQKSLSRERPGGIAAAAPRSVPGLWKKLLHEPKTVPGKIHGCSSSSRTPRASSAASSRSAASRRPSSRSDSARRSSSTARRRCARRPRAARRLSASSGRVFYGTKAFPNVAVLRLLREEGVGADVASARRARVRPRRRAHRARSSSCTATTRTRRSCARRHEERAPVVVDAPDEVAARGGRGRRARARPGDARRRRRHARGDRHRAPRLEVRAPAGRGAGGDRGCARTGARRARACTSTSARSSPTSRRRRRRSGGSRRSPPTAATSLGWEARVADLGGGFGIRHHRDDDVPEAAELARAAAATAREEFAAVGLAAPEVWLEPGRASSAGPGSPSIASAP